MVTYVDSKRQIETWPLDWVALYGSEEVQERLRYCCAVLKEILDKKSRRLGAV